MGQASKHNKTETQHRDDMAEIKRSYHQDETEVLEYLLPLAKQTPHAQVKIDTHAGKLIQNVRANRENFGGIDRFLQEFGLTTKEGIALMCLSEALLRIPDAETADKLIKDKIGSATWEEHLGQADDLFVNASTWALMLTGKVIGEFDELGNEKPGNIFGNMVARLGEPVVRRSMLHGMKILGQQFVMGRDIKSALKRAKDSEKLGYRYSYDMLGEGARTDADAVRYQQSYLDAIHAIGTMMQKNHDNVTPATAAGISIKLSALHPRYHFSQKDSCIPELTDKLMILARAAADYNIGLTVDAEEAFRLEMSLEIIENVFAHPDLKSWDGFGLALQAYQKRAVHVVDWLENLARKTGKKMMIRLVKGAYWDSEIKHAQVEGLTSYPVFTRKFSTDVSYLACAKKLMQARDVFYPQFATHNAHTVASIIQMAGAEQYGFEFQRLHGMGEPLYHQIIGHENTETGKYPVRVYAPVGSHEDLLPYLVRRLLENGANSSFVNRIHDDRVAIDDMIIDPVAYVKKLKKKPHPHIALPENIYGHHRKNAMGYDIADTHGSGDLIQSMIRHSKKTDYTATALINGEAQNAGIKKAITSPFDREMRIGDVIMADADICEDALQTTHEAFKNWSETPVKERAEVLNNFADLLEEHMAEIGGLCMAEAGKTIIDTIADIREAVDFCRYYAQQAIEHFAHPVTMPGPTGEANQLSYTGRGTYLCISPWNFPVAIYVGQIVAALVTGNCVIAKPADQTPITAFEVIKLLFKAGLPKDVLAFVPCAGKVAGQFLVPDQRIHGVCFTGSTETAQVINQTLAARDGMMVPLIAETGGQNALIVDSSALPEQVVDDIITSGFQSAGQRCSALRVLYLQDEIADKVMTMLDGAAQKLIVDTPQQLKTDIGPVIDQDALDRLTAHKSYIETCGTKVTEVPLAENCDSGTFFAPCAYEIKDISVLKREVFGPIVHIVRYKAKDLDKVIDEINNTGYGLTFGVHTRIESQMRYITRKMRVGNCYVNRSIIGAVVGVQPFGGMGLSGTGPKAGGPNYLHRFVTERTMTIDTTASGGNASLVSLAEDDVL